MSRVIQCDACKGIIELHAPYEVNLKVVKDEHTIVSAQNHHACSKKCVGQLFTDAAKKVEVSR